MSCPCCNENHDIWDCPKKDTDPDVWYEAMCGDRLVFEDEPA